MSDDNAYRSKMGAFYAVTILFIFMLGIILLLWLPSDPASIAIAAVLWATALFFLFMWSRAKYTLKENGLLIRTTFAEREIEYLSVTQIKDESGHMAYHGMWVVFSTDLILITYDKRGVIWISPVKKQEFLSKLRVRCPLAYL
jgi:hypothetical protein